MSDYGLFESDEASQAEPRLAAITASRKLEAAIDGVRRDFGRFLIAATGIDEFEDRWHLSKHDIRASVEPMVFPNTGTMRRIKNALKADWKLAHPYKLAIDHDDAGFGSMPEGDGPPRNQNLQKTYHPSDGNLIPEGDFHGWKDSVDQGGPEKVEANDFTPGGDSGSAKNARRRVARDPRHHDMVGRDEWMSGPLDDRSLDDPDYTHPFSPGEAKHEFYRDVMEEPPAGYARRDRSPFEDREAARLVADIYTDFAQSNGLRVASLDTLDHYAATGIHESDYRLLQSMIIRAAEECEDDDDKEESDESDSESDSSDSESDSEAPEASESDDDDDSDTEDEEYDFGGSDDSEADTDDDGDHDDDDHHTEDDGGEEYDFGGGDESGAEQGGGQQYTVPEQAPDLDPQMLNEIPHDDTDGSAPVPPEVVDSLLGLPPGTIEQLLLEEVEQGQGGGDSFGGPPPGGDEFGGAPQGGGDDFLGGGGGDADQPPPGPRMARRRQQRRANVTRGFAEHLMAQGIDPHSIDDQEELNDHLANYINGHPGLSDDAALAHYHEIAERLSTNGFDDDLPEQPGPEKTYGHGDVRNAARQFWAAPDESEADLMGRQQRQQRDAIDTKFGPSPEAKPDIQELYARAQGGDHEAYSTLKGLYQQRGWTAARRFWAADGEQQPEGGEQDPAQDPAAAQGGMDPAAMGGGMMPPPGSQSVAPPQPAQPLENQPAEDALLDTANQAIMQMIDRETSEYQQIIGPLSQALQAVQFAQQVEQSEHPMDVTPPEGSVNVDPSAAPGGAQNPQQQLARMMRQAKVDFAIRNAAKVIAKTYRVSESMLVEAMSRRHYEHVAEAFRILPPQALQTPEVRAAALHVGKMFAAENQMFNQEKWMDSVLGGGTARAASRGRLPFDSARLAAGIREASDPRDREWDAWASGRDRGMAEHGRHDLTEGLHDYLDDGGDRDPGLDYHEDHIREHYPEPTSYSSDTGAYYPSRESDGPDYTELPSQQYATGIDPDMLRRMKPHEYLSSRTAGETWTNTPTMDRFEFPNEQPEITDNMTINDLPKPQYKGLPKHKAERRMLGWGTKGAPKVPGEKSGDDVMGKYQRYTDQRTQKGLNFGDSDVTVESFMRDRKIGDEAGGKLHKELGISHPPTATVPAKTPKPSVPKAKNPVTKRGTWGEWEPPKTASFFTRRVPGWRWDDHLSGYLSKEARAFTCACGEKIASPSYKTCACGKVWNVYAIGDSHHLGSNTADMFIAREIPVRDNVIMANKKLAGFPSDGFDDPDECSVCGGHVDETGECTNCGLDDRGRRNNDKYGPHGPGVGYHPHRRSTKTAKDGECTCWEGYERVPGTEPCASGSCRKKSSRQADLSQRELVAMIDKLADWTKYDSPDPINEMGKSKPPPTSVAKPPKDWATRLPKGDPSKRGGTWTPPTIPRKKK